MSKTNIHDRLGELQTQLRQQNWAQIERHAAALEKLFDDAERAAWRILDAAHTASVNVDLTRHEQPLMRDWAEVVPTICEGVLNLVDALERCAALLEPPAEPSPTTTEQAAAVT
jgi:hypothetical protein